MNHDDDDHESYGQYKPMQYSQMKESSSDMNMMEKMKKMMDNKNENYNDHGNMDMQSYKRHDDMSTMFKNMGFQNQMKSRNDDFSLDSMFRSMGQMRFKRQADDSLALNDRLKEKLVGMMEEHVNMVSNMTCVLKELNVIDHNNNVDLVALKEDSKQYKMPSQWFGDKYEEILEGCHEVSENLPASLQEEYVPSNYNGPMRNLGKIKSFMNCCKSAKMKLCMNQDTKKKIEANFGPVEELVEGFNNQLTEDQVFFMVNQLLEGSEEDQYM